MVWRLVAETGIPAGRASSPVMTEGERLSYPTYAEQAEDGTYLIAEEQGIDKQVPFRFECRTIRVDADGRVLFDTSTRGMDDGYGCLLDDGHMAILRRTHWSLMVVSPTGECLRELPLHTFSKQLPRYVRATCHGTFLIVFFNRSYENDIVEIDRQGRLLWYLPASVKSIGIAGGAELTPQGTLLIADPFRHVVTEFDRNGRTVWQFGELDSPAADSLHCSSPTSVVGVSGGSRLLADTRNHRILAIGSDGRASVVEVREPLCDPTHVAKLANGHFLICDTGNTAIQEVDHRGETVWHYGRLAHPYRCLSYPRSVAATRNGTVIIADTGNNRIVQWPQGDSAALHIVGGDHLFWPRCVRPLPTGSLLVADARNGRIVELSSKGRLLRQVAEIEWQGKRQLSDPHDVWMLPNGHLLVTDSPQNLVFELDWTGAVFMVFGADRTVQLKDPHSAQPLPDGSVLISDTAQHRIVLLASDGTVLRDIQVIDGDRERFRLHQPRYAEMSENGTLVIADTGQNRILGATSTGQFLWEFQRVTDSAVPFLNQPRWATLVRPDELLVCDHFHHRVLRARWSAGRPPGTVAAENCPR